MSGEMKAMVSLAGDDDLFVGVPPSGHAVVLDTDRGRNSAPSPMELLLVALGSCTAVDVISILRKKRQQVTGYHVEVTGARRDEHPRGFNRLEVRHVLRGHGLSEKAIAQAVKLSEEKYCSVAASLRPAAEILSSYQIIEEGAAVAE